MNFNTLVIEDKRKDELNVEQPLSWIMTMTSMTPTGAGDNTGSKLQVLQNELKFGTLLHIRSLQ